MGAYPGYVEIKRKDGEAWTAQTNLAEKGIPIIMINDLLDRFPDGELLIVKVDIEGFEQNLFSAATEWIARALTIIVEPHDWMLPYADTSQTLQQAMLGSNRDLLICGENLIW